MASPTNKWIVRIGWTCLFVIGLAVVFSPWITYYFEIIRVAIGLLFVIGLLDALKHYPDGK